MRTYYILTGKTIDIRLPFNTETEAEAQRLAWIEEDKKELPGENTENDYYIIEDTELPGVTRTWKVYGADGHRQKESFNDSEHYNWTNGDNGVRVVEVINSDQTGTNEYTIVKITRDTAEECEEELNGQISDGIFENKRVGRVEEIV